MRIDVPVISVGNLTAGGTGKTPLVEYLIRYYLMLNKKIAVLSRGYKRTTYGMKIVSDGSSIYGTAATMGDEPFQIARKFPRVIVVVDENRVRAAKMVVEKYTPDVILLDDGFQHRGIVRDLNIVVIDGRRPLSEIHMIPAGLRREPISALRRADFLILSQNSGSSETRLNDLLQHSGKSATIVRFKPSVLREFVTDAEVSLSSDRRTNCVAFCGIGNPDSFKETLAEIGFSIEEFIVFPDHHQYDLNDMKKIQNKYDKCKVDYLITTEKDAMRLRSIQLPETFPLKSMYFIEIVAIITEGEKQLHSLLEKTIMKVA